jgi:hypothetical protein
MFTRTASKPAFFALPMATLCIGNRTVETQKSQLFPIVSAKGMATIKHLPATAPAV